MRDLNNFVDDEFRDVNDAMAVEVPNSASEYLNPYLNNETEKCVDSGIVYDPDEVKNGSKFSIDSHESQYRKNLMKGKTLNDSGIDSIAKISSTREFHSKQSLSKSSIRSTSVSTVAVPMREARATNRIRSNRYSLPDIDKLKQYNDVKSGKKSSAMTARKPAHCDNKPETQVIIPLVPTEAKALASVAKPNENFTIDPKLINKYDGLSQSLYYIDENGSPKIRERYIKQQRLLIEKQEQKRREKEARKELDAANGSCSCFNFTRLSKKLKELCK